MACCPNEKVRSLFRLPVLTASIACCEISSPGIRIKRRLHNSLYTEVSSSYPI